jgi:hypothetical protein
MNMERSKDKIKFLPDSLFLETSMALGELIDS